MRKSIEDIVKSFEYIRKYQILQLKYIKREIEYIIKNNTIDEKLIENVFDRLLDISFLLGEDTKEIYYELLKYYNNINKETSENYKKYYLEIISDN